jgi:Condensation domain
MHAPGLPGFRERRSIPQRREASLGPVALTANRYSYFFKRQNNLPYWNITSRALQTVEPLNMPALEHAANTLITHHDGLRLQLRFNGNVWEQAIDEPSSVDPLIRIDAGHCTTEDGLAEFVRKNIQIVCGSFSFPGELFRILSIQLKGGCAILFVAAHHLILDGYSFSFVLRDLFDLYRQHRSGHTASLPPKTTSLLDYARESTVHWLNQADKDLPYWESLPWNRVQPIPADYPERLDSHFEKYTARVVKSITIHELFVALSKYAPDNLTFADTLLAAIGRAYYRWTGHSVLHLAMVFDGRESFLPDIDLSRTAGWLSETIPILIEATKPLGELVDNLHFQIRTASLRGKSYGVLRYLSGDAPQFVGLQQHPHPCVSLNVKLPRAVSGSFKDIAEPNVQYDPCLSEMDDTRRVFHLSGGAYFRDRRFHLAWDFSSALFSIGTIEEFSNNCIRELIAISSALKASI